MRGVKFVIGMIVYPKLRVDEGRAELKSEKKGADGLVRDPQGQRADQPL
jgi:hypothetical protein